MRSTGTTVSRPSPAVIGTANARTAHPIAGRQAVPTTRMAAAPAKRTADADTDTKCATPAITKLTATKPVAANHIRRLGGAAGRATAGTRIMRALVGSDTAARWSPTQSVAKPGGRAR